MSANVTRAGKAVQLAALAIAAAAGSCCVASYFAEQCWAVTLERASGETY